MHTVYIFRITKLLKNKDFFSQYGKQMPERTAANVI